MNYIKPELLTPGGKMDDRMARLGFSGQLIYQHPIDDKPGQLVVLSASSDADFAVEKKFAQVLSDFHVRFVPNSEAEEFAAEVERTAH